MHAILNKILMEKFKPGTPSNPFQNGPPKKEPGAGTDIKKHSELHRLIESATGSLAAEVRFNATPAGLKIDLVGRLSGNPLVRKWECYSYVPAFKAETPVSTGLSAESPHSISVTSWKQAIQDLGQPLSMEANFDHAIVIWKKGADELKATVRPEKLIEADIPFEVKNISSRVISSDHPIEVNGDIEFKDLVTCKFNTLGRGEYSTEYSISPAQLTKVGSRSHASDQEKVVALLKPSLKELPVHNAERKLKIAEQALIDHVLDEIPKTIQTVGLAQSITLKTISHTASEEVTGHYGDERWGTGQYTNITRTARYLVCDGVDVYLPEHKGIIGGAFSNTADVVARAYLILEMREMEKKMEEYKAKIEAVNLSYYGVPDPAIYGDFNEKGINPDEVAARKKTETILDTLNARMEEARAAAMLGLERTDPAAAETRSAILPEYEQTYTTLNEAAEQEQLERFLPLNESRYAVFALLKKANEAKKAKNHLGVSSKLLEIEKTLAEFQQKIAEARANKKAYFESKAIAQSKAEELKIAIAALQNHPNFRHLPRDISRKVREAASTNLEPSKWKVNQYNHWNTNTEELLHEVEALLDAPRTEVATDETIPVPVISYAEDARNKKAEYKQEKELTQSETLGAALAERAKSVLGLDLAIRTIQNEYEAPYGRARRQAALSETIGSGEVSALNELFGLSKAAVFDSALAYALSTLQKETTPTITKKPTPKPAEETKPVEEKPPEAPSKPADVSAFDMSKLFGGQGGKNKQKGKK